MQTHHESTLSAIEIEFFAEGERAEPDSAPAEAPVGRRAHLSRYLKWVVAIVAAAVALIAFAAHERAAPMNADEASRPAAAQRS
jgi:hypothetical protein